MKDKSIQELINLYHSGKLTIVEKKVIELIKKNPKSFVLYNLFGAVLSNQKNFIYKYIVLVRIYFFV